jgi:hypothetical protein
LYSGFDRIEGKSTAPDYTSRNASCEERWDKAVLIATRDLGYSMSDKIV